MDDELGRASGRSRRCARARRVGSRPHCLHNDLHLKYAYQTAGGAWTTDTIDSTVWARDYVSLAVDGAGGVHVAYYDGTNEDLRYAYRAPCAR